MTKGIIVPFVLFFFAIYGVETLELKLEMSDLLTVSEGVLSTEQNPD